MKRSVGPHQEEVVSIYNVTNQSSLKSSGIATLLTAKNSLCVARNDAQLAMYDTTDFNNHTIVKTPTQGHICRRGFARDFHVRHDEATLKKYAREFEEDPSYGRWKQELQAKIDNASRRATHSHEHMRSSAIASNQTGNIVCMAKNIDDCSALEIHTISGKSADELTLKRTIPCSGYFAMTDLAYTPNQTCVSIANDAITEWDALTGKAIRIGAHSIPEAKLDFSNQDKDINPRRTVMLGSSIFAPVIGFVLPVDPPSEKKLESRMLEAPFGDRGRLLPIGRNILVSAHYDKLSLYARYIGMLDMRAKRMFCHPMKMKSWHVYDMVQSPSENCFLTGGDEAYEDVYWNMFKEWDWRKIGFPTNSESKPEPVRIFDVEVGGRFSATIRTLATHKNNILAIVTQQNQVQEKGTFLQVWDSAKYKTGDRLWDAIKNYPAQTIKISDSIEPNVHISVLEDDRVLVADSKQLLELKLATN